MYHKTAKHIPSLRNIDNIHDLVMYAAESQGIPIAQLGNILKIDHFPEKINTDHPAKLSPQDVLAVRKYLITLSKSPSSDISLNKINEILPSPFATLKTDDNFQALLNHFAQLATNGDANQFRHDVTQLSGQDYPPNILFQWGTNGYGLAAALPHIIAALETNPNTRDAFDEHKQHFLALAEVALPTRPSKNVSEQLLQASDINALFTKLEKKDVSGEAIITAYNQHCGTTFTNDDYAQWKAGNAPNNDPNFGAHLTQAIAQALHNKPSSVWLMTDARKHIGSLVNQVQRQTPTESAPTEQTHTEQSHIEHVIPSTKVSHAQPETTPPVNPRADWVIVTEPKQKNYIGNLFFHHNLDGQYSGNLRAIHDNLYHLTYDTNNQLCWLVPPEVAYNAKIKTEKSSIYDEDGFLQYARFLEQQLELSPPKTHTHVEACAHNTVKPNSASR